MVLAMGMGWGWDRLTKIHGSRQRQPIDKKRATNRETYITGGVVRAHSINTVFIWRNLGEKSAKQGLEAQVNALVRSKTIIYRVVVIITILTDTLMMVTDQKELIVK